MNFNHIPRITGFLSLALVLLSGGSLQGQIFPLSENSWDNPEFVKRFTGSYGIKSEIEPSITQEEGKIFEAITPLLDQGNFQAAAQQLRSAITPESSAALNYTLGSILLQMQQTDAAIQQYQTAIQKFPSFMRAYKNLGLAHLQEGRFAEAQPMLVKAIELGDMDSNTFGFLGYIYLNEGRHDAAADAYSIARVLMPSNRDWRVGKASALMQAGRYEEAIISFKDLIGDEPTRAQYYTSIANAYISLGDPNEAAKYLEVLRRLGGAEAPALALLGDIYVNQEMPDVAVQVYQEAVQAGENVPVASLLRSVSALISRGSYNEAEQLIANLSESLGDTLTDAQELELLNAQSQIAMARGEREEAVEILERVVQLDPLNGRALMLLGSVAQEQNDFETAQFYYERAEKLPDFEAEALVQQARMKVSQRQYREAVTLLERSQLIRPRENVGDYLQAVRDAYEASR